MKFLVSIILIVLSVSFAYANQAVMTMTEGTATTTSTLAISTNVNRRYLLIQNKGSHSIYVKIQSAHEVGEEGVVIVAGGNWEPTVVPVDSIFLQSASATSDFTIVQGR